MSGTSILAAQIINAEHFTIQRNGDVEQWLRSQTNVGHVERTLGTPIPVVDTQQHFAYQAVRLKAVGNCSDPKKRELKTASSFHTGSLSPLAKSASVSCTSAS